MDLENGSKELIIRLDERVKHLSEEFTSILEGYKNIPEVCRKNQTDCRYEVDSRFERVYQDIDNLEYEIRKFDSDNPILFKIIIELIRFIIILVAAKEISTV
jgi:hypothetical protein